MTIQELHARAIENADIAFVKKFNGETEEARFFFKEAFRYEKQAAILAEKECFEEPTVSILYKSAASLAINCNKDDEAIIFIDKALKGNPYPEIKEELKVILNEIDARKNSSNSFKKIRSVEILIVNNEINQAIYLVEFLIKVGYSITGIAASNDEVLTLLEDNSTDLIIVDVDLESDFDSVGLLKKRLSHFPIPIIYLAKSDDENLFKQAEVTFYQSYLAKPFSMNQLSVEIHKALMENKKGENEYISKGLINDVFIFDKNSGYRKIKVDDIFIIESFGAYSKIYLSDMEHSLMVSVNPDYILKSLNSPFLMRVHESFYVNVNKIQSLEKNGNSTILTIGKHKIPVSREFIRHNINMLKKLY